MKRPSALTVQSYPPIFRCEWFGDETTEDQWLSILGTDDAAQRLVHFEQVDSKNSQLAFGCVEIALAPYRQYTSNVEKSFDPPVHMEQPLYFELCLHDLKVISTDELEKNIRNMFPNSSSMLREYTEHKQSFSHFLSVRCESVSYLPFVDLDNRPMPIFYVSHKLITCIDEHQVSIHCCLPSFAPLPYIITDYSCTSYLTREEDKKEGGGEEVSLSDVFSDVSQAYARSGNSEEEKKVGDYNRRPSPPSSIGACKRRVQFRSGYRDYVMLHYLASYTWLPNISHSLWSSSFQNIRSIEVWSRPVGSNSPTLICLENESFIYVGLHVIQFEGDGSLPLAISPATPTNPPTPPMFETEHNWYVLPSRDTESVLRCPKKENQSGILTQTTNWILVAKTMQANEELYKIKTDVIQFNPHLSFTYKF